MAKADAQGLESQAGADDKAGMRVLPLALLATTLAGCESARLLPAKVSGNEAYVSVSNVWNEADALPYAEKHCGQYGKIPAFKSKSGYSVAFDCVKA